MRSFKQKQEMELSEWFSIMLIVIISIIITVAALCVALTVSVIAISISVIIGFCTLVVLFFTGVYESILTKYKNRKKA